MTSPLHHGLINGLSEIAENYDALLCDAWGVIHNGLELYDGVAEALTQFRKNHGPVFVLTNAPRLSDVIPLQLDRLGLPRDAYDGVVTSGDATKNEVEKFKGKPAFRVGPAKDDTIFEAFNIDFVALEEASFIFCTGLFDDETETPEDYRELLTNAKNIGLPMICANPDIIVKLGNRTIYCGGALAQLYEEIGGQTILAGKPFSPIYDLAQERIASVHPEGTPKRVLAIGDGLQTDILGANQHTIDVAFIAEGIFSASARNAEGQIDLNKLTALFNEHDVHAQAVMERLVW